MEYQLNQCLLTDKNYYFISFLTDRFESLNDLWAKHLEKKFGKKFKPIYILPAKHNSLFEEENYIVINKRQEEIRKSTHRDNSIVLVYPEDINKQFCKSPFIRKLLDNLIKKQSKIFILGFSNVWLNLKDPRIILLGPKPSVAAKFDNKAKHIHVFKTLNLPYNTTRIFQNFDELLKGRKTYPFFISASFSSGGFESKIIYSKEDLEKFYISLRQINKKGEFIVSKLINNIKLAPNSSAIIAGKNKTTLICITDQLLRDNKYMGNMYPSQADSQHQKLIEQQTIKVGNYLSLFGFKGLFGMDFLITEDGKCFPTDINPRRQGGYFCNVMMSKKVDIIDLELKLALGESIQNITSQDFQVNYSWAHSKLTPYFHDMVIEKELKDGTPSEPFKKIGSVYSAIYYPKDYLLVSGNPGFYLITSNSYEKMKKTLIEDTEKIISKNFNIYKGLGNV